MPYAGQLLMIFDFAMLDEYVSPTAIVGVMAIYGIVSLLFGYRLWKFFIFLAGFLVGFAIAALCKENNCLMLVGYGFLAGLLSMLLWYVSIFLIGAAIGSGLLLVAGVTAWPALLAAVVVCGILAILLRKLLIIVSTSFSGAESLVVLAFTLLNIEEEKLQLIAIAALTIFGVVCQYTVTSGKKRRPPVKMVASNAAEAPQVESPTPESAPESVSVD